MNLLHDQLTRNEWTLLASLPKNDVQLARAALKGGAQGLKVHINVEHFASGTRFGSLEEEHEKIARIVAEAREFGANVGIVPGANEKFASPEDFAKLRELGVDYFDAYPFDCPAWAMLQRDLDVMVAAYHGMPNEELPVYEQLGMTLCEASIMAHDSYGAPLKARDLASYSALCASIKSPVIIPSQKKLEPRDVSALRKTGARGVLLGAIVLGREAQTIETALRAFRSA
ncbi:hypothetical protein IAD21_01834 [Abditibacteriota bacterium]|nr:hypothetical protein IAD21_01834 [Abditibacteriota bacterium]